MNQNNRRPKVSVYVLAYKHANYISKCLDSIFSQRVNFNYEVIFGDDCSNDGTKEILEGYRNKFPEIIQVFINEKNIGGTRTAQSLICRCTGEYICGIEGDDFWCDLNKLQKQADYLDTHKDIMGVGSNFYSVNHEGTEGVLVLSKGEVGREYCLKDYFNAGMMVIHGNTLMYRNILPKSGEKFERVRFCAPTMGDVFNRCLIYDSGNIYVMPEPTLCHRDGLKDKTSFSSEQVNRSLYYSEMYLKIVKEINNYFGGKYDVTELFCNRMSVLFIDRSLRHVRFRWSDYFQLLNQIPFRIRIKMPLKVCIILKTKLVRKAYRTLCKEAKYNEQ